MNLDKKIDYSIALLRKAESMALRLDPENGFYLAFSGGKDSQALYHIAQMAGVKFKAHMNLTSVDPPEVIRFVRRQYPDVELIKPKMSIYEMAKKKHILPTMRFRWCCAEYKEFSGDGKVNLIGIRNKKSSPQTILISFHARHLTVPGFLFHHNLNEHELERTERPCLQDRLRTRLARRRIQ